ncbi:MAG: hypothetical protein ABR923_08245 [Terracidiphilus sp.]
MGSSAFLSITETPGFSHSRNFRSSQPGLLPSLAFGMMGTALGLLAGIAAAANPWSGNTTVMANDSVQMSASAAGSGRSVNLHTLKTHSIQTPVSQTMATTAAPVPVSASLEASLPHIPAAVPMHHTAFKSIVKSEVPSETATVAMTSAAEAPAAPAPAPMAVNSVAAAPETTSRPASVMIEGDLTMADFDASTGTVETREGRSFTVSQAGSDGNTLSWQDYSGNVHYRCTQAGDCTLSGSGISTGARIL